MLKKKLLFFFRLCLKQDLFTNPKTIVIVAYNHMGTLFLRVESAKLRGINLVTRTSPLAFPSHPKVKGKVLGTRLKAVSQQIYNMISSLN